MKMTMKQLRHLIREELQVAADNRVRETLDEGKIKNAVIAALIAGGALSAARSPEQMDADAESIAQEFWLKQPDFVKNPESAKNFETFLGKVVDKYIELADKK